MAKAIIMSAGSKGGVGKSLVSMALLDWLQANGEKPVLVETDTSNPDCWKAYKDVVVNATMSLDDANGWIDLVNLADAKPESVFVVNTAARNNAGVASFGATLANTLGELKRDLLTLWTINRQRDGLALAKAYREAIPVGQFHVVLNGHFGPVEKFELYAGSKLKESVEAAGGKSLYLPDLADRVADDLYSQRLTIAAAAQSLPLGNRAELQRWRSLVHTMLGQIQG